MRKAWRSIVLRLVRLGRRAVAAAAFAVAAYLTLLLYPQPLFAHSLPRDNVVLHARQPLPPEAAVQLADVVRRISRSPLYDAGRTHHVFLCDTPELYGFFALWNHRSGYLLQERGLGVDELLARPRDRAALEHELRAVR